MEWGQVLAIAAINVGLIAWLRTDIKTMQASITDFHGRLCRLEEKYCQMMQRFLEKNDPR